MDNEKKLARYKPMTKQQYAKWIYTIVVKPAGDKWGAGWNRLSVEQQETEVQAQCLSILLAWSQHGPVGHDDIVKLLRTALSFVRSDEEAV